MCSKTLLVFSLFFLSLPFAVSALEAVPGWTPACINSTHLLKSADIYFNNTLYEWNQTIACPYGCDTYRDVCWKWPGEAVPGEYYLLFEALLIGLLIIIIYRLDINEGDVRVFDVVMPLMAAILSYILALQGNNVIDTTTGEAMRVIMVVWFNYGMSVLCLIPFFLMLFKFIGKQVGS